MDSINERQEFIKDVVACTVLLFISPIVGALIGAIAGWVVGLFFLASMHSVMVSLGIAPIPIWQFGAFLGFVGGFFRPHVKTP